MMKRLWLILLIISVLVSGCGVFESLIFDDEADSIPMTDIPSEPPILYILRGDVAFPMDMGSYCWTAGDVGLCVDTIPPIYTGEMHTLVIGNTLELMFDAPYPDEVYVALHPGSNMMTRIADIMAEATMGDGGRVLVTVPESVDGHYVLMVTAVWDDNILPHGDAFYATPIRFGE